MRIKILIVKLFIVFFSFSAYAQEREKYSFLDRSSLKTNVFEWLITVPNIGVEFDVVRSQFKKMSIGVTAKYNWNTWHQKAPATVFDLFDVRPEFRYYLRTNNTKISRPWWTMYVGPYLSYGTYTFKLGQKGISGWSAGTGVSFGYCVPMYEYKKGAIDVEFGLSVGLQACTKDVFTHNPEGYYYVKSEDQSRGLHFTPYPVLSEVKVAFVWRKESIRHQVAFDEEKSQRKKKYKNDYDLMIKEIYMNLPMSMIRDYQTREALVEAVESMVDYLKGENSLRNSSYGFRPGTIREIERKIDKRAKSVINEYEITKRKEGGQ